MITELLSGQNSQYLQNTAIADIRLKKPGTDAILAYYISNYIDAFATVKTDPSKIAINKIMLNKYIKNYEDILSLPTLVMDADVPPVPEVIEQPPAYTETLPVYTETLTLEDERPQLTSQEKRYILKECHANYFSSIIKIMAAKKASGRAANLSADEVIQESELLRVEFKSLIAFDQIKAIKNKVDQVRGIIQSYVNQVILVSQLDDNSAPQLISQIRAALGKQQAKLLFEVIAGSENYPTSLDMLDNITEELRGKIRGIDLFLHLPSSAPSSVPFIRNTAALIRQSIANADAPKPASTSSQESPRPFFDTRPSAGSSSRASSSSIPKRSQSHSSPFGIFDAMDQFKGNMDAYKQKMQQYKNQCIATNKKSNFQLFYNIANGLEITSEIIRANPQLINIKDNYGNSALQLAALCGNAEAFRALKRYPFDMSEKNGNGQTLLHLAILGESPNIVRDMVKQDDVDIYEKNADGKDAVLFSLEVCQQNSGIPTIVMQSFRFRSSKTY